MGYVPDTIQVGSDNYFTVKGITRADGDVITAITSVTAEILDSSFTSLTPDTTITLTAIDGETTSYEGTFPDTITLSHESTYYVRLQLLRMGSP